jgi:hypothetical protein
MLAQSHSTNQSLKLNLRLVMTLCKVLDPLEKPVKRKQLAKRFCLHQSCLHGVFIARVFLRKKISMVFRQLLAFFHHSDTLREERISGIR